jgi:uncharacterized lipoprotein YajG
VITEATAEATGFVILIDEDDPQRTVFIIKEEIIMKRKSLSLSAPIQYFPFFVLFLCVQPPNTINCLPSFSYISTSSVVVNAVVVITVIVFKASLG